MAAFHLTDPRAPSLFSSEARLAKLAAFYHLPEGKSPIDLMAGHEEMIDQVADWAAEVIGASNPPMHPALAAASVAAPPIYDMANASEWGMTFQQALMLRGTLETLLTDLLLLLGEESQPAPRPSVADWRRRAAAATSTTADLAQIGQSAAQVMQAAGWL